MSRRRFAGHLKRWFIEPKPNVFVGTLNARTHRKVMEFILRNAPLDFGMLVISSAPNCQGYVVERIGPEGKTGRRDVELSGIPLIAENWINPGNCPF
jgi:CRISPR-associated protein Cas2